MAEWSGELEIDAARAARWIASALPELAGMPVREAGWGWDNAVFRVGSDWVVRMPRREMGAELLELELAVLPHLAGRLPVAIPRPRQVGGPLDDYPWRFAVYRWLDGTTADRVPLDDGERARFAGPVGRFLGALHRCDPGPDATAADPGDTIHRADRARRLPTLLERLAELADHPGVDAAAVEAELRGGLDAPSWDREPVWVHGDLYPRHLVIDAERRLVGVIDWGDSHRGDPALDLAIAWTFLPDAAHRSFREAYGGVDEATWERARFRALHYGINLLRFGRATDDGPMVEVALRALTPRRRRPPR